MLKVYRLTVSDGTVKHFPSEVEANFYAKDLKKMGFAYIFHEVTMPQTPEQFADYLDDVYETIPSMAYGVRDRTSGPND